MDTNPSPDRLTTRLNWTAIQSVYGADSTEHLTRARSLGLNCPEGVFEQLFHDHHDDDQLAEGPTLRGLASGDLGAARALRCRVAPSRRPASFSGSRRRGASENGRGGLHRRASAGRGALSGGPHLDSRADPSRWRRPSVTGRVRAPGRL